MRKTIVTISGEVLGSISGTNFSAAILSAWRGFTKIGVYTNGNLLILKKCLENRGVKAGRIFNDKKLGIDLLQVIDPESNVLEIISRSSD